MSMTPLVSSAEELPAAIVFAGRHPTSRWYVASRARAFGQDDAIPQDWNIPPVTAAVKQFTDEDRTKLAKEGVAMPDGSYPIPDASHVSAAVDDFNRTGASVDVKKHIIQRAVALHATAELPPDWVDPDHDGDNDLIASKDTDHDDAAYRKSLGLAASGELTDEEMVNPLVASSLSVEARQKAAQDGEALPDGSFPIRNKAELHKAINLRNNGTASKKKVIAHIRKRAKALGCEDDPALEALTAGVERDIERGEHAFDEALHPRGHDGEFILKGGRVQVVGGDGRPEAEGIVQKIEQGANGADNITLKTDAGAEITAPAHSIQNAPKAEAHLGATRQVKPVEVTARSNKAYVAKADAANAATEAANASGSASDHEAAHAAHETAAAAAPSASHAMMHQDAAAGHGRIVSDANRDERVAGGVEPVRGLGARPERARIANAATRKANASGAAKDHHAAADAHEAAAASAGSSGPKFDHERAAQLHREIAEGSTGPVRLKQGESYSLTTGEHKAADGTVLSVHGHPVASPEEQKAALVNRVRPTAETPEVKDAADKTRAAYNASGGANGRHGVAVPGLHNTAADRHDDAAEANRKIGDEEQAAAHDVASAEHREKAKNAPSYHAEYEERAAAARGGAGVPFKDADREAMYSGGADGDRAQFVANRDYHQNVLDSRKAGEDPTSGDLLFHTQARNAAKGRISNIDLKEANRAALVKHANDVGDSTLVSRNEAASARSEEADRERGSYKPHAYLFNNEDKAYNEAADAPHEIHQHVNTFGKDDTRVWRKNTNGTYDLIGENGKRSRSGLWSNQTRSQVEQDAVGHSLGHGFFSDHNKDGSASIPGSNDRDSKAALASRVRTPYIPQSPEEHSANAKEIAAKHGLSETEVKAATVSAHPDGSVLLSHYDGSRTRDYTLHPDGSIEQHYGSKQTLPPEKAIALGRAKVELDEKNKPFYEHNKPSVDAERTAIEGFADKHESAGDGLTSYTQNPATGNHEETGTFPAAAPEKGYAIPAPPSKYDTASKAAEDADNHATEVGTPEAHRAAAEANDKAADASPDLATAGMHGRIADTHRRDAAAAEKHEQTMASPLVQNAQDRVRTIQNREVEATEQRGRLANKASEKALTSTDAAEFSGTAFDHHQAGLDHRSAANAHEALRGRVVTAGHTAEAHRQQAALHENKAHELTQQANDTEKAIGDAQSMGAGIQRPTPPSADTYNQHGDPITSDRDYAHAMMDHAEGYQEENESDDDLGDGERDDDLDGQMAQIRSKLAVGDHKGAGDSADHLRGQLAMSYADDGELPERPSRAGSPTRSDPEEGESPLHGVAAQDAEQASYKANASAGNNTDALGRAALHDEAANAHEEAAAESRAAGDTAGARKHEDIAADHQAEARMARDGDGGDENDRSAAFSDKVWGHLNKNNHPDDLDAADDDIEGAIGDHFDRHVSEGGTPAQDDDAAEKTARNIESSFGLRDINDTEGDDEDEEPSAGVDNGAGDESHEAQVEGFRRGLTSGHTDADAKQLSDALDQHLAGGGTLANATEALQPTKDRLANPLRSRLDAKQAGQRFQHREAAGGGHEVIDTHNDNQVMGTFKGKPNASKAANDLNANPLRARMDAKQNARFQHRETEGGHEVVDTQTGQRVGKVYKGKPNASKRANDLNKTWSQPYTGPTTRSAPDIGHVGTPAEARREEMLRNGGSIADRMRAAQAQIVANYSEQELNAAIARYPAGNMDGDVARAEKARRATAFADSTRNDDPASMDPIKLKIARDSAARQVKTNQDAVDRLSSAHSNDETLAFRRQKLAEAKDRVKALDAERAKRIDFNSLAQHYSRGQSFGYHPETKVRAPGSAANGGRVIEQAGIPIGTIRKDTHGEGVTSYHVEDEHGRVVSDGISNSQHFSVKQLMQHHADRQNQNDSAASHAAATAELATHERDPQTGVRATDAPISPATTDDELQRRADAGDEAAGREGMRRLASRTEIENNARAIRDRIGMSGRATTPVPVTDARTDVRDASSSSLHIVRDTDGDYTVSHGGTGAVSEDHGHPRWSVNSVAETPNESHGKWIKTEGDAQEVAAKAGSIDKLLTEAKGKSANTQPTRLAITHLPDGSTHVANYDSERGIGFINPDGSVKVDNSHRRDNYNGEWNKPLESGTDSGGAAAAQAITDAEAKAGLRRRVDEGKA